jgi:nicotinate-nucleotide pyrophosphorylase (carboxylating)
MSKRIIPFPKKIEKLSPFFLKNLIELAVREDLNGIGDITSVTCFKEIKDEIKTAKVIAKEDGIVCGVDVFKTVYETATSSLLTEIEILKTDGSNVRRGETVIRIKGRASSIAVPERIALNFLGLLSGVATKANRLSSSIAHTSAKLLDTRKTIPGLRELQKYAVAIGGGFNHRIGLYDMILIKDNHIRAVGSIGKAVSLAGETYPEIVIEVETGTIAEVEEALKTDADIIMLDNMDNPTVAKALTLIEGEKWVEVSGNIDEHRLVELAQMGVDFISMGALTHSVSPLDFSLLVDL